MDEVTICNLALSHLGDPAQIPEGDGTIEGSGGSSTQEILCRQYYPIARTSMLEMAPWSFALRRIELTSTTNPTTAHDYAYTMPDDVLRILSILPPDLDDDYVQPGQADTNYRYLLLPIAYAPQNFTLELNDSDDKLILTDVNDAVARYTTDITDTTMFPSLFVIALSWHLASMLAGPIVKGEEGRVVGLRCEQRRDTYMAQARMLDADQRQAKPIHTPDWIARR